MKKHASILKVVMKYKNQKGRKLDHKQLFVNTYFFSIYKGIESKIRYVNKLTKHLTVPKSLRKKLFIKFNSI